MAPETVGYLLQAHSPAQDVFLYSLETKKATQKLYSGLLQRQASSFAHNGKYLYSFHALLLSEHGSRPRLHYYSLSGIFAVTLKPDEESPFRAAERRRKSGTKEDRRRGQEDYKQERQPESRRRQKEGTTYEQERKEE